MRPTRALILALLCLVAVVGAADDKPFLHPLFSPHGVLQQGKPMPVWGWTTPGAVVKVQLGKQALTTTAQADGRWEVIGKPLAVADGPLTLTVSGPQSITVEDLLVGEVWLCSGQSNMFWFMNAVEDSAAEMATSDIPNIRLFSLLEKSVASPLAAPTDIIHRWTYCHPSAIGNFSAVAFYFGRELHKRLGVPVGLISSPYGGTNAETWMSEEALRQFGEFNSLLDALDEARPSFLDGTFKTENHPLFKNIRTIPTLAGNAMLTPLAGFPLAGVVWYQGESNAGAAKQYRRLLPALIADWRNQWKDPKLPFVIVQLAGLGKPHTEPVTDDEGWVALMESQALVSREVPYCGLACAYDQGRVEDVHPLVKKEVGRRIVYPALAVAYGNKDLPAGGPVAISAKREGKSVRVRFKDVGKGLEVRGGEGVTTCAIGGAEGPLVWATVKVEKDSILVSSPDVKEPTRIQLAYDNNPPAQLFNPEGCPVVPFRLEVTK